VFAAAPNTECIEVSDKPGLRQEWFVASRFANANAGHYHLIICLARLAGMGWSVLGGWLVYLWARQLYGYGAGIFGLCIWCFEPNIIAHAQLVTPDMPAAVAALGSTFVFWRYLRSGRWDLAYAAGVLLGIAQLTKFTMLALYLVWPVLFIAHSFDRTNQLFRSVPSGTKAAQACLMCFLSLLVLNAGYTFEKTGTPLGDYEFTSELLRGKADSPATLSKIPLGNRFKDTWLGRIPVPLPGAYVTGIDLQQRDFEIKAEPSFLAGEWKSGGWWHYYLFALAIKVPVGLLCLFTWSLALFLVRRPAFASFADELTIWLPAGALLLLVSSQTGFSHHMRYVLPMFPFAIVAVAKLGYFVRPGRWKFGIPVVALLVWTIVSSLSVYPHSLSYFNELVGGPDNGQRYLLDSNIDWGQDLLYLKDWADGHPEASPLALAYYSSIDHRICGAEYPAVPQDPRPKNPLSQVPEQRVGPHPGFFALDLYSLTRLRYKYFERFQPISKAGYSIFIYHITLEQAEKARQEMGLPPLESVNEPPRAQILIDLRALPA